MEFRQKNNIFGLDMVNLMMLARENKITVEESDVASKWSDDELVAQCFLFFFSGFDTSSTALAFAAHELVVNPDIQQKLYEEIVEMSKQLGGKPIFYDAIQTMKYLDQVVCETLRKWPPTPQTDRKCVKDYVYDDGKLKFKIEKGSNVICPLIGLHHDPQYFPNPEIFDPERFNHENKDKIVPGTYIPFGVGPRNCIGEL